MKPININPGERFKGHVQLPDNANPASVELKLKGECGGCGGQVVPHKTKPLVWVCQNERWWKPWQRHARLEAKVWL